MTAVSGTPSSTYQVYRNPVTQNHYGRAHPSARSRTRVVRYNMAAITSCAGTETPLQ